MSNEMPQPGSIIQLVSNAQIRYEGTLELIKMAPEESSLSLSSVKSYGTEDRVEPALYVPASEERFEYVVFKGTDIISLDVKEYYRGPPRQPFAPPPAPAPAPAYQQQTAVWGPPGTSSQQGSWNQQAPPHAIPAQQPSAPQYAQPSAPPAPAGQHSPAPAPTVIVTPSMSARNQADPARQPAPRQSAWSNARPAATVTTQPAPPPKPYVPAPAAVPVQQLEFQQQSQQSQLANAPVPPADNAGPPPGFNGPPPGMQPNSGAPPRQAPSSYAHAAGATSPGAGADRGRGRGRARGRGRGRGPREAHANGPPRAPPVPVPREDFNFEEALSRFDKDKLKEEADYVEGPEEIPAAPQGYKKDDFFDALSSDLNDRLTTADRPVRKPFSEQRKLDMETFGGSGVARRPGRGRGRGRGGRGRGRGRAPPPTALAVS